MGGPRILSAKGAEPHELCTASLNAGPPPHYLLHGVDIKGGYSQIKGNEK